MYVPQGKIVIPIKPITKPVWKPTFRGHGGSWGSKTYTKFRQEVVEPLENACKDIDILWEPLEIIVEVRPAAPKKSKFPFPQGDVDNFSKAILDACTDILWIDDWQIQSETINKRWNHSLENENFFSVAWKIVPEYATAPIFKERKLGKEMANGQ